MATYDIGNKIRLTGTFTDPLNDDAAVDLACVYCTVVNPAGVHNEYQYGVGTEITKGSTGVYYIDQPLIVAGDWFVRWWGKDSNGKESAAEEVQLRCVAHQAKV